MIGQRTLQDIEDCANCQLDDASIDIQHHTGCPMTPGLQQSLENRKQAERVLDWVREQRNEPAESRGEKAPRLLDSEFPPGERLPRRMEILIEENKNGQAITTVNGVVVGNPLRDNRRREDGYRFHDVFHVANAAMLGWSPVLRAMLRRKRKSNDQVDEVEDGGRAIVIEEGILAMVFSHAEGRKFLGNDEPMNRWLFQTIGEMTHHLEVRVRTQEEWEHAIRAGFQAWRQVRKQGGGKLVADLERRSLEVA